MLYLTDSQVEQVTPAMTVQEIRAMREPKPGPVEVLAGQLSFEDFGITEQPEAAADTQGPASCVVTVQDLMPEPVDIPVYQAEVPDIDFNTVATSQQETGVEIPESDAEWDETDEEDPEEDSGDYEYIWKVRRLLWNRQELIDQNLHIFGAQRFEDLDDEIKTCMENDYIVIAALECYLSVLTETEDERAAV